MSLYSEFFYSASFNGLFSDSQTIEYMLRFEAALAQAQAKEGLIPADAGDIIKANCKAEFIDIEKLKAEVKLGGNAAIPLVQQLSKIVEKQNIEASKYIHLGATSQDVIDTATMLAVQAYTVKMISKINKLKEILAQITTSHRNTLMIGCTLLQQARPITFGLKTATWLQSIEQCGDRISELPATTLFLQLGGAVGSGNQYLTKQVQAEIANHLGLKDSHSWHANRGGIATIASVYGILNQSLAKIAKDISLLMQTEVGEVFEGSAEGKGGSSAMPHKRNPVTCTAILANSTRIPNLVASILAAMPQEHERSAGMWQSEWEVLTELLKLTAGSLEKTQELIMGLEVDKDRMLQNLDLTHGLIFAENVSIALAESVGKLNARELVKKACKSAIAQKKHLKMVLYEMDLNLPDLDLLFDAEKSTGNSAAIIDDILSKYQKLIQK